MVVFTTFLGAASAICFFLYWRWGIGWLQPAAITLLTMFYHFAMRLAVGETVALLFRNKDFPQDKWGFRLYDFEGKLYRRLKVKHWKANVITAKPSQFDVKRVGPKELLHNMMQAELVHRWIMLLSFAPLLFIIPFGEPAVFAITSIGACIIDSVFVVIQRYNRPRVLRYIALLEKKNSYL